MLIVAQQWERFISGRESICNGNNGKVCHARSAYSFELMGAQWESVNCIPSAGWLRTLARHLRNVRLQVTIVLNVTRRGRRRSFDKPGVGVRTIFIFHWVFDECIGYYKREMY